MRACVVGSTNVDLVLTVPVLPQAGETLLAIDSRREAGGKGANQAVALARLGAEVKFVSAVGQDEPGRWSLEQLAAEGIDLTEVAVLTGIPTGLAVVVVDRSGENLIVVAPGANGHVVPASAYEQVNVVLLSLEIPLETVSATASAAHAAGVPVVLNAAPARALPSTLLRSLDVLVLNEHELRLLAGSAEDLQADGPKAVVVTQGAAGCLVVDGSGTRRIPAANVEVVDTTGAGDCFAAALTCGVGRGWGLDRSVELAVAAAGLSVGTPGARGGFPSKDQLAPELQ
jgi:ribokinase